MHPTKQMSDLLQDQVSLTEETAIKTEGLLVQIGFKDVSNNLVEKKFSQEASALIFSRSSPSKARYYLHVLGDSNSEGLRPGAESEFNMEILMGLNVDTPWPFVMESMLRKEGVRITVENHSEGARRIAGKTYLEGGKSSIGEKDGRVALQGIVSDIINKHTENSDKIIIMIDLGANDLHDSNITPEYLKGSIIKLVLTILTNSNLQYRLLRKMKGDEYASTLNFIKKLNAFVSADIRENFRDKPIESSGGSAEKIATHGKIFDEIINTENKNLITKLFKMIGWKIILVPSVEISGFPFGKDVFVSADLSKQWKKIILEVVEFFNVDNIFAVEEAQKFVIPHTDEFGGCVHLDAKDHQVFGQEMASFLLSTDKLKMRDDMQQAKNASSNSGSAKDELKQVKSSM